MRVPPLLEPSACPGANCSNRTTSEPRRASHHAVDDPIAPAPITATSTLWFVMQARRYVALNTGAVSGDTPGDEVLDLTDPIPDPAPPTPPRRANRPLVATRVASKQTTEEILSEIEERATKAYAQQRINARRSSREGRTSTS